MGATKQYLLSLFENCCDSQEKEDALQWALNCGLCKPCYDLDLDVLRILTMWGVIWEGYQRYVSEHGAAERGEEAA